MSDSLKSIWFAAVTALISSLLLTGASSGLKEYRLQNIKIDTQKNLLKSVGLVKDQQRYSDTQIETIYRENVRSYRADAAGQIAPDTGQDATGLPLFLFVKDKTIQAYILPVHSRGLWGQIDGYLAIESDGRTVAGFTVYNHGETPGLGGEIEKNWFQDNFRGKGIVDQNGRFASIRIAKGKAADRVPPESRANYVDGISGATLTGRFLSEGLRETLLAYEDVSEKFRNGNIHIGAHTTQ